MMNINDQLLLAHGAGYSDAQKFSESFGEPVPDDKDYIFLYRNVSVEFTLDCAETRERLCFNLRISLYYGLIGNTKDKWLVEHYAMRKSIACTTQEEISDAINTVALAILREKAE